MMVTIFGGGLVDGIIPLYKERGMTSFDCVNRVRHIVHEAHVGHAGTLDPNVDGVLPICLGKATKCVDFLHEKPKEYSGELTIGIATTTEDLDGEIINQKKLDHQISDERIKSAMSSLTGTITQIPPMYSSVKVNGKRLYEYARAGETVQRPSRQIQINHFKMVANNFDAQKGQQRVRFVVNCSKGTYVRTLAVDLAKRLGYPGVMSSLTRTKSGGFSLDQTLSLEDLSDLAANQLIAQYILPLEIVFEDWQHIDLTKEQWQGVKNGAWLKKSELPADVDKRVALMYQSHLKALYYRRDENHYAPLKMISTKA